MSSGSLEFPVPGDALSLHAPERSSALSDRISTPVEANPLVRQSSRNLRLDTCRIAASVAILWMHTWQSAQLPQFCEIGRFGVPFFTCSAFFLLMQSFYRRRNRAFLPFFNGRFLRLYLPFLFWGVLGLALMFIKHRFISHKPMHDLNAGFFISGASFQLWYLPFLLIGETLMFPLCWFFTAAPRRMDIMLGLILLAPAVWLALLPPIGGFPASDTWQQVAMFTSVAQRAAPSIFTGLAAAMFFNQRSVPPWLSRLGLIGTIVTITLVQLHGRNMLLEAGSGLGLLIFALRDGDSSFERFCSRYVFLAYAMYLCQNVVLEPTQVLMNKLGVERTNLHEAGVFVLVLMLAILTSLLFRQWKSMRWVLGEARPSAN